MALNRISWILVVLSLTTAANAQKETFHIDTVLWSTIHQAVLVGNGTTIYNNTPVDRTIYTFYKQPQFTVKYNNLDTTLHRAYIRFIPLLDRPVNKFVLQVNSYLTILPVAESPDKIFFFADPREVPEFAQEIKLGIFSSYIEAIVCGMVLMMTLYMIGKYVQLRTQVYFFYGLYLLFTLLFLTVVLLYTTQYLLQMPLVRGYLHHVAQSASHACYFQFVRYFIQTRQHQPLFDKMLNWATVFSIVYIVVDGIALLLFKEQYPYRMVWDGAQVFFLIAGVTFLVFVTRSPTVLKNYLIIGTIALLIGGVVGLLVLFMPQWIENLPVPLNLQVVYFRIGIVIEIIAFALGLGYMQRLDEIIRAKTETKLEQEHQQVLTLQEVNTLKTKFFSNITHEFRTPLTLIQGPAKELYGRETNPESKQMLGLIQANSDRLLKLINQLLDLAKLDAREMKLKLEPVDLNHLVKMTASQFTSIATLKGIEYEMKISDDIPSIIADLEKTEAILSNLISNAIKFTSSGGRVTVHAHWEQDTFIIGVSDTGRGIPPEKLEHIFDRFYQVDPADAGNSEGTGIGLALVKEYVELMKGVLEVESEIGLGTVFNIKLKLERSNVAINESSPTESELAQSYRPTASKIPMSTLDGNEHQPLLLLVEDNDDIRFFIKTCLGNQYRYMEARQGKEGLAIARAEVPDLIISDWMMPEMDGVEFLNLIKKDKRTDHIPFILLTAKGTVENKIEGLQTGADDYLIKPFNKEELVLKIQNLLTLRDRLHAHIKHILLLNVTSAQATSAEEKFIIKAKAFVEKHLADENLTVETLAAEMTLSREQLYRKIMALAGYSPSTFIRKLRLQKAAQLLAAKADTVSQIAYETGFNNLSHFSKSFKEEFGKLPSEFASESDIQE